MSDECYDPYDLSNYVKATSTKDATADTPDDSTNNINPSMKKQQVKHVFNPYEHKTTPNDETEPLQNESTTTAANKKAQQDQQANIDLTRNAYSDMHNNNNKQTDSATDEEEELPLLEELGINLQNIKKKIISILTVHRIDKQFLKDSDMAGPFLIFVLFALSLMLQKKTCFGYLYGITVMGSILLCLILNLMSRTSSILLYDTISVLGYCLIPIVLLSFLGVVMSMKGVLPGILCIMCTTSSSISASRFFEIALDMSGQKFLIFYPVALFYTCFVLVAIF